MSDSLRDTFGEPISTYTQEQAIEDGMFYVVPNPAQHGFGVKVVITSALFYSYKHEDDETTGLRTAALLKAAKEALAAGDGEFAAFTSGLMEEQLFVTVNGDGVTVMLASDY